jgi:O-antigen/teichoic acid export membrane protein
MSELKNKFIHSVTWTAGSNVGGFLINFFLGIWLARILGPEAYGLVGMVMVVTGFGRLFIDFGFGEALIQNQNVEDKDFSSVFWFNIIIAIVLFILFFGLSEFLANFYNQPNLESISKVLSSIFVLNALGIVQRIKLEKEFKFKVIAIAEVLSSLLSIIIGLLLALNSFGVWSLVYLNLLKPTFYSLIVWSFSNWWPSFILNSKSLRKLSRFSLALLLNGFFEIIASNIDKILIGKTLGEVNLGIYNKSVSTVRMPVSQLMSATGRVIFPLFASIQQENERIFSIYKKFFLAISNFILPVTVIFYFFSTEIIHFVFGIKWVDMIPIFKLLSLTLVPLSFNILADQVVKAKGNQKHLNYITFIEKPVTVFSLCLGIYFGSIYYVTVFATMAMFINFFIKTKIICLSLNQSIISLLKIYLGTLKTVAIPVSYLIISTSIYRFDYFLGFVLGLALSFLASFWLFRRSTVIPLFDFISGIVNRK